MPELGEIWISVKGRKNDLDRTLDQSKADAKKKGGEAANLYAAEFSSKFKAAEKTIKAAMSGVLLAGAGAFAKEAIESSRDLEDALAKVKVNAGATDKEMKVVAKTAEDLSDKHKNLGKVTSDYAKAMLEGVWAGQKLDAAMKSAENSVNLAGAAQMDVAESSQVVANALNVFKLEAEQSAKVTDVLAVAAGKASGSLGDLIKGFQQGSALAAQAGLNIEDLASALGLMANNGILGSDAGTSLKSMLLQIMNPSEEARKIIKRLGLEFYDATGHMKPFGEIIDILDQKMSKLTDQQKNKILGNLFGSDGIRAALVMMKEGRKTFEDFKEGMDKTGRAAELANGNIGEVTKMTNELKVEFDKFVRESGKDVVEIFKDLLKVARDVLKTWRDLEPETKHAIKQWGLYALALGPVASKLADIYKITKMIKEGGLLASALGGAGAASGAGAAAGSGAAAAGGAGLGMLAWPATAALGSYVIWDEWTSQIKAGEDAFNKGNAQERSNKEVIKKALYQKLVKFNGDFDKAAAEVFKENSKSYPNGPQPLSYTLAGWKSEFESVSPAVFGGSGKIVHKDAWMKAANDYVSDLQEQRVNQERFKKTSGSSKISGFDGKGIDSEGNLTKPTKDRAEKAADELTKGILEGMSKSIRTPDREASCAYFASALLKETGVQISKTPGAKDLVDAILKSGGVKIDRKDAAPGDMVYYRGPGYGKIKFNENGQRVGYHVGVYAGNGYSIESSGDGPGHQRTRGVGKDAIYIRPKRTGKFENTGQLAEKAANDWEEFLKVMEAEARRLAESLEPIIRFKNARAADALRKSGGSQRDVISMREFGKVFGDLTDQANRNRVVGIDMQETYDAQQSSGRKAASDFVGKWIDNINDANRRIQEKNRERDAVKNFTNELERQLQKEREVSNVELALGEIKRRGLMVTGEEFDKIMELAQAKDDEAKADKKRAEQAKAMEKLQAYRNKGMEEYSEAMRELGERMQSLGRSSEINEFRLQKFALSFAGGNEEMARSTEVLGRAKQYMMELAKVEDMERMRNLFQEVADGMVTPIRDSFFDLVRIDMPDFFRDFGSLIDNALRDLSTKIIDFQIRTRLSGVIEWAVGRIFGGGGDGVWNTPTSEWDVDYQDMQAKSSSRSRPMATDAGATNIYITINATDGPSVISSLDQISTGIAGQISEAKRKF